MSDPTGYSVVYSFSGFQANNPTSPLPAPNLDNEFANIADSNASIIQALKNIRRPDGALNNGVVTYESLSLALQLIFDPTDGEAVANAVAAAQAAATAASGSATAAGASATGAAVSAAAAAVSAATVNLSLYLSKAGNLGGIGNADTARANINAAKVDGSDMTGRLAPNALNVLDFNSAVLNGWYQGLSAANAPDAGLWIVEVQAANAFAIIQVGHSPNQFPGGSSNVVPMRRYSWNNGGVLAWTAWESMSPVAVGSVQQFPSVNAPAGYLKLNGALLSRAAFPALWNYALNSGNLATEADWSSFGSGAFSIGDLSTTFRLPDARGEFFRAYDNGRGVDSGRVIGVRQSDLLKDHTHNYNHREGTVHQDGTTSATVQTQLVTEATSGVNGGLGGAETRPRNIALLACIKY